MLPGAEAPLQQGGPARGGRRLIAPAEGRQGGQAHGGRALQPQLQVAAVEQGVQAPHRQGQHDQGGGSARGQGPAGGQLGAALAGEQFGGHAAAGASPHRRSALHHQGGQGQEGGAGLAGIQCLGEGRRASQQLQGHGPGAAGSGQHRQPKGGVEALRLARINVVAEQVEAAVQRHIQVGCRHAATGAGESGKQDPGLANQLGIVVIHQQHPIQAPGQGGNVLGTQHDGGGLGQGGGGSGQDGQEHQGGRPPGCAVGQGCGVGAVAVHLRPTRVLATSPAMARIKSVERGSLKGPFTMNAATARWPVGS